ncbi:MAG: PhnD/SsuA/transferrin family substrate-binding protein [Frankiaceae bacterium]|nr:PhnD/SsuA/transferrin family substrate-binding protein [Arenimonas sp.]
MKLRSKFAISLVLSISTFVAAQAADFTVTVEPNYPPAQAQDVYRPLLAYLSKATGHRFILKTAGNYHVYWRDMRGGAATDFAFEEAHFTDYRVNRQRFTPLVRVVDPTKFTLLVDSANANAGANGLIGRRIASMSAPSLGYLLLGELYKNPIAQPEIQSVAASWKDGVEMVFAGETEAAMVPGYIAQTYPNLVPVATSRDFIGRAFSASPKVPMDVRKKVADALLRLHKDKTLFDVLSELGATQFVPANAADYAGSERLLRGVFGYQPMPSRPGAAPAPGTSTTPQGISIKAERGG